MLIVLSGIMLYFNFSISDWYIYIIINLFIVWVIYRLVNKYEYLAETKGEKNITNLNPLKIARYWYGVAAILFIFKQVYIIGYSLKPADWDPVFMRMDFAIFGLNPTQWVNRFENPFFN